MRDMLHSEIAEVHIATGLRLCEELLEPLRERWGRLAIRSTYRSP